MTHNEQATYKDLWEPFVGRPFSWQGDARVRVTLDRKSTFYLNKAAFAALGEARAVEFMFSKKMEAIGLIPSDLRRESAFPIKPRNKKGVIYGYLIHGAAFMHHHDLRAGRMVHFNKITVMPDGMMVLPLAYITKVRTGAK